MPFLKNVIQKSLKGLLFLMSIHYTLHAQLKNINLDNRISNNSITTIYQDSQGFMWFGTFDGLNRYDGYSVNVFKNDLQDSLSLPNNRISAILEDQYKHLWVGTKYGLYQLNQKKWQFSPFLYISKPADSLSVKKLTHPINCLLQGRHGGFFIGTAGEGLILLDKGKSTGMRIPVIDHGRKQYQFHVQALTSDVNGRIWCFLQNYGIARYDARRKALLVFDRTIGHANSLWADHHGYIWLGDDQGLHQYRLKNGMPQYVKRLALPNHSPILSLFEDKKGNLWVGSDGDGVYRIDGSSEKIYHYSAGDGPDQLSSGAVYAVFEDREERKWIGTLRGGVQLIDYTINRFAHIERYLGSPGERLSSNFILSFCEKNPDEIWIGTDGDGLNFWERKKNRFTHFKNDPRNKESLSNNYVVNLIKGDREDIWIATYGGGINRFDPKTRRFKRYDCFNSRYHYNNNFVWALYKDAQGDIWAGTLSDGGLYRYNKQADRFELFDADLRNILTFCEDRNGRLWAGTFNSLVSIDRKTKKHVYYPIGYAVRAIKEDRDGHLWIGTEGGGLKLMDRSTGQVSTFSESDGLSENAVLGILESDQGKLWLSTFNGLSEFDPLEKSFRNFYQSDGLQSNQFNYNAAAKLSSGEMLFGGINGFNIFKPSEVKNLSTSPKALITDIRINNKSIEKAGIAYVGRNVSDIRQLDLPYDKSVVSIDFASLNYSFPDKVHYAFYLEGWEKDWNFVGQSRTANYGTLPPGRYLFHVKTTNIDGKWNGRQTLLSIRVSPPWWGSWWAYLIYGATLVSLIYSYFRFRRKALTLRYEMEKAMLEKENEHKLNEKKIAFFTHVSHEFRTPLTLIIDPLRQMLAHKQAYNEQALHTIFKNSRRLLSMVDQLLLFKQANNGLEKLKIVQLDLTELCTEVFQCYQQQAIQQEVDFHLETGENIELAYCDREKVEIMLFNLLTNAFKYTPKGGMINLSLDVDGPCFQIRIADSGCGIDPLLASTLFQEFTRDPKSQKSGFGIGLYLVKKFAELHQGTISFTNRPEGGTLFTLSLPRGKVHWGDRLIMEEIAGGSVFLEELMKDEQLCADQPVDVSLQNTLITPIIETKPTLWVIDDHKEIQEYLAQVFGDEYAICLFSDARSALGALQHQTPHIILCDVMMDDMDGITFCERLKTDKVWQHIPLILLTADTSEARQIKGIEFGADGYINKPFNSKLLAVKIKAVLKQKKRHEENVFERITLTDQGVTEEDRLFISRCEELIEKHVNETFGIRDIASALNMSHSTFYKKIKQISGRSAAEFMRFIKIRKAAKALVSEDININQASLIAGFTDIKYFREQFQKEFGLTPSAYVKRYRKQFQKRYQLNKK